jgi:cell pole-organizing protein PopZ
MTESQSSAAQGAQGQPQSQPGATAAGDPSMEDILASIRRILSEDEAQETPEAELPAGPGAPASGEIDGDDVLVLDESMMVPDEAAPFPAAPPPSLAVLPQNAPSPPASAAPPSAPPQAAEPAADPSALLAPEAAQAAASSMGKLIRALADQLTPQQVGSGGPTIEDIVREEIRPLLQAWLDANLPPLTEQVVREEIQRLADRAAH